MEGDAITGAAISQESAGRGLGSVRQISSASNGGNKSLDTKYPSSEIKTVRMPATRTARAGLGMNIEAVGGPTAVFTILLVGVMDGFGRASSCREEETRSHFVVPIIPHR